MFVALQAVIQNRLRMILDSQRLQQGLIYICFYDHMAHEDIQFKF